MQKEIIFIYDGECPFCNKFAELLELKSKLPNLTLRNGRKEFKELSSICNKGFNLNNGALLLKDEEVIQGADAINYICSKLENPSDGLLELLKLIFSSKERSHFFFPFLIWARRGVLFLKGIPATVNL